MRTTSSRLLTLLSLLQTRRDWSGEDLAGRLGISSRTVRRDIDRLRELGYLITTVKGPAGGYRLEAGTRMPPMLFDDDQAVALAVALQTAATGTTTLAEDASRALATLRQVMPPRLRHRIDLLRVTAVPPDATPDSPQLDTQVLVDLGRVINAREELRFDYTSGPGTSADGPRRVEPHHLVTWRQLWYLLAWDLDREDWRTFRVERIRPRTPTGPRFAPRQLPGGSVSAFVTSRFRGGDGTTADWPCQGDVILHLPAADVAPFAGDGIVEALGRDRCRLTLGSWSWTGLAAAIGRFDTDVDVVGPPELATACADLAARYARAARTARPDR
jgi:predicted DNA-binding transcriptional regulator YafY